MSSLRARAFSELMTFTRASVGAYCDAAGVLQSAAVDVPRIDYYPTTHAARGMLIEEARTNYLLRSQEFDNASWSKARASISANAATAPDGTITADKLVEDSTVNDTHCCYQSYTKTSSAESQAYALSVWVKAAERTQIYLYAQGSSGSANDARVLCDLSAGTVGTVTTQGAWDRAWASIEAWPKGWYRCTLGFRVNNDGQASVVPIVFLASGGSLSYTGDGSSGLYLWGAQLEKGVQATSYIATTTAAATRSADLCSTATLTPWFSETEGTLFAEYLYPWPASIVGDLSRRVVEINDGTDDNRALLYYNGESSYGLVTTGAVTQASASFGPHTQGAVHRQAMAWAENDWAAGARDGSLATDSTGTVPTGLTTLRLGNVNDAYQLNGHLRKLRYYPRRLSDAELLALVA